MCGAAAGTLRGGAPWWLIVNLSLQDHEVPRSQEEVQGDAASVRREGRDRAVLGRSPGHAVPHQEPADQVGPGSKQSLGCSVFTRTGSVFLQTCSSLFASLTGWMGWSDHEP